MVMMFSVAVLPTGKKEDFALIEKISQTLRECFIGYPNTSNFVKNTLLCVVFSTPLGVWI